MIIDCNRFTQKSYRLPFCIFLIKTKTGRGNNFISVILGPIILGTFIAVSCNIGTKFLIILNKKRPVEVNRTVIGSSKLVYL